MWHNKPVDVEVSGSLFVSAMVLLKYIRADVSATKDGTALTDDQFETALQDLKAIFQKHFLRHTSLKLSLAGLLFRSRFQK